MRTERIDGLNGRATCLLALGTVIVFLAGALRAADMVGNVTLTANNGVLTLGGGDAPGITGTNSVWSWNDKDGDGVAGDFVSAGMNMAGFTLQRSWQSAANKDVTLNLWNGTANGSITGNGILKSVVTAAVGSDDTKSDLTVTNVSGVSVNTVDTSPTYYGADAGAQTITGDDTGAFVAGTMNASGTTRDGMSDGANISVQRFASVSVTGSIQTWGVNTRAGNVAIGTSANPIGGSITLGNIQASRSSGNTSAGSASLYANGPIQLGNFMSGNSDSGAPGSAAGNFTAVHKGAFTGGTFTMISGRDLQAFAPSASFNGTDSTGAFTSGGIDVHRNSDGGGPVSGTITIQNYTDVTVNGNLYTYNVFAKNGGAININTGITGSITVNGNVRSSSADATAGSITMSATGNITITGSANLDGVADANEGDLSIANAGAGAMIRLGSLDINQVKNATLNAGSGKSHMLRELANFPTSTPTASGLSAGADGKYVFYNPAVPANFYLLAAGSPLGAYGLGSGKGTLTNRVAAQELTGIFWNGSSSTDFEAGGNWSGGSAPASDLETHAATFGTKGALANPALSANRGVGGVVFTNAGWTLSGGARGRTLSVGIGGIDSAGSGTNTVSANVALPPEWAGAWTVGSGNVLDVTGVVSSNGYLTKDGAGTLRLSATNTISGQIAVTGGALDVATDGGLGTAAFYMTGGTANFLSPSPSVVSLRDGGANSGTVRLGNPGVNDTTLTVGSDNASTTFSGMLADATGRTGSVTKVGSGTLTLAGSNTFSGTLTVSGGGVQGLAQASGAGSPFGSGTGAVVLNGASLLLSNGGASVGREPATKGALAYCGAVQIQLTGSAAAGAVLTFASATRDATYRSGLLVRGMNNSMGVNEKMIVTTRGADLSNDAYNMVRPWYIILTAVNNGQFATYDAVNGLKALAFNETNVANADPGEIVTSPGVAVAEPKTMHSLHFQGNANMTGSALTITSGGLIGTGDGRMSIQNTIIFPSGVEGVIIPLPNSNGDTLGVTGDMQGDSGVTKLGSQQLSFTGCPNRTNLTGPTSVLQGNLTFNNENALGPTSNELVLNGGGLNLGDYGIDLYRQIRIGPNGGWFNAVDGNRANNLYGKVTGPGLFTKTGNQRLRFYNSGNDWTGGFQMTAANVEVQATSSLGTGGVRVSGGALHLYGASNMSATAALFVASACSASMYATTSPSQLGSLSGAGTVYLGPSSGSGTTTLMVGGDNTSTVFTGAVRDQDAVNGRLGGIRKMGTGTLKLLGANNFTGATVVSNGALIASGTVGGTVNVASGAGFGGTVTVANLSLADHAEIWCNMSGPDGTNVDKVVTGGLTLGANTVLRLFDTGVTGRPRGDSVLIQYSGDDPALGNWTVDCGDTGWPAGKVKQDTAAKQIILRFARNYGTVVVVR